MTENYQQIRTDDFLISTTNLDNTYKMPFQQNLRNYD